MKYLKLFENIDSWELGNNIANICRIWKNELRMDEVIINETKKQIYLKAYNEMNNFTMKDYQKLFNTLTELKCKWSYPDGRNIIINYSEVNKDDVELFLDAKKYNL